MPQPNKECPRCNRRMIQANDWYVCVECFIKINSQPNKECPRCSKSFQVRASIKKKFCSSQCCHVNKENPVAFTEKRRDYARKYYEKHKNDPVFWEKRRNSYQNYKLSKKLTK
jgi:hypothetical protein